ncbi:MAG: symbB, partial [Akkermansiaceae bacterium]|nr:symbB [Akkermansiaceae bacterium]
MENSLSKKGARVLPALMAILTLVGGFAAEGATHTYQYFRFTPTKFRNPATPEVQMSEFRFRLDNTLVTPTAITAPTGNSPAGETVANLKDTLLTTKWFSFAHSPLVFSFASPVSVNNYSFATGNDEEGRDPVSWTLEGSATGTTGPWTLIDVVTDFNTTINRRVFIGDFVIPAELPPAFTFFDVTPSIVLNGQSTDLDWFASGSPVSTLTPSGGDISDLTYSPVTPPANQDTEYVLTATNSAGSLSSKHTVRAVAGGTASYRYVRFRPLAVRSLTSTEIQMADFRFYGTANTDEKIPVAVYEEGGSPTETAAEGPNKLRDGLPATKWYSATKKNLIFDFGSTQAFDTYRITSGNDSIDRDPVRWILEGSADATTWTRFDDVSLFDYDVPIARLQEFSVPVPGGSLPPLADFAADSIKVLTGEPLKLTWTTQDAASVTISPSPGTVAASGTVTLTPAASTNYTLTATSPAGFKTVRTIPVTVVSSPVSTIAYDSFDTESGELSLVGFASVLNDFANIPKPGNAKRLRVVPDVTGRGGAAWFSKRVPVATGFDTTFNFMITKGDPGVGADGFAFVVQDDPAGDGALGSGEAGLAARALNVQFDTYQNAGELSAAFLRVLTGTTVQITLNL